MDNMLELMMAEQRKLAVQNVLECNEKTEQFGLILSQEDAKYLVAVKDTSLKDAQRVEFGSSILPAVIFTFCDSQYIRQENYKDTIAQLQEIFFLFKNEVQDELTDNELLDFMKQQFEDVCGGDLEYLSGTCLERFARAIRSGYQSHAQRRLRDEYSMGQNGNEYSQFCEEAGWDYELFRMKLEELE